MSSQFRDRTRRLKNGSDWRDESAFKMPAGGLGRLPKNPGTGQAAAQIAFGLTFSWRLWRRPIHGTSAADLTSRVASGNIVNESRILEVGSQEPVRLSDSIRFEDPS